MRLRRTALVLFALCVGASASAQTVVLIGGPPSEGVGRHDYPNGVRALQSLLESSQDASRDLRVVAYPDGWPDHPRALDAADTVLWYFDGNDKHPLHDPAHRAMWESALRRGTGLIALHQASTVPTDDDLGVPRALGAARRGLFDRTTEWAELSPAIPSHPLVRGVSGIAYRDEFYPTVQPYSSQHPTTPILSATLHPQFRDGHALVEDVPEPTAVAWAFERDDGGRAFAFTGAHFLAALDTPGLRTLLLNAVAWTARRDVPAHGLRATSAPAAADVPAAAPKHEAAIATFHVDRARSGWRANETVLSPATVANGDFGQVWESPPLDGPGGEPARLYASPLHVDGVAMTQGQHRGATFSVVFATTNHGDAIAVNAAPSGDVAPGRILWRTRLGEACRLQPAPLDGVPTGILSTPVIDIARGRLYVTHCDPAARWQAYAIDITSGDVLPGWPVRLDEETFNAVNRNAGPMRVPPKRRFDFRVQRGALNLSPDGTRLYVVFGESETGWLVSVDTQAAHVDSAFAAVAMPHRGSGGIWGAGGPAVDARGRVHVVTGSGFDGHQDVAHDWTQSLLQLAQPGTTGFELQGTYTPFNHCGSAAMDIDLGSGGAMLLPSIADDAAQLLAIGGKQGNVYLLDANRLPGRLDRRPPCSDDASTDASLLPPQAQPQFGTRGPLNVFGPYSEKDAALDLARARSVPAAFRDASGNLQLFVTGNSKRAEGSADSVPPSLVRLDVVRDDGVSPYLRVAAANQTLVFGNPGSPVVTSNGARDAIVWVLDENAARSALLAGDSAPQPVLYAFAADDLRLLWRSAPGALFTSGKYNAPAFGGGRVFVGTDRIQAFGVGGRDVANRVRAAATLPVAAPTAEGLDGAAIYRQRCAACHEHPVGNIPPRSVIATRSHASIVDTLTRGVMRVHAAGLSPEQIDDVARFLEAGFLQ